MDSALFGCDKGIDRYSLPYEQQKPAYVTELGNMKKFDGRFPKFMLVPRHQALKVWTAAYYRQTISETKMKTLNTSGNRLCKSHNFVSINCLRFY